MHFQSNIDLSHLGITQDKNINRNLSMEKLVEETVLNGEGVLGLNGSGKSTLLRIMAGVEEDFLGNAVLSKGYRVGYLEQEPQLDPDKTVKEVVQEGVQEVVDLLKEYDAAEALLNNSVFSTDGSTLEADRDLPIEFAAINVGYVNINYGDDSGAEFDSALSFYPDPKIQEIDSRVLSDVNSMSALRPVMEIEYLVEKMETFKILDTETLYRKSNSGKSIKPSTTIMVCRFQNSKTPILQI